MSVQEPEDGFESGDQESGEDDEVFYDYTSFLNDALGPLSSSEQFLRKAVGFVCRERRKAWTMRMKSPTKTTRTSDKEGGRGCSLAKPNAI